MNIQQNTHMSNSSDQNNFIHHESHVHVGGLLQLVYGFRDLEMSRTDNSDYIWINDIT